MQTVTVSGVWSVDEVIILYGKHYYVFKIITLTQEGESRGEIDFSDHSVTMG
jgi:hypothetical protein